MLESKHNYDNTNLTGINEGLAYLKPFQNSNYKGVTGPGRNLKSVQIWFLFEVKSKAQNPSLTR